MNNISWVKQGLSHAKTVLYRSPKAEIQRVFRWGPWSYWRTPHWAKKMERAAERLPACEAKGKSPELKIWFLSGREHWYQTAFCAWTLQRWSAYNITPVIVDDGNFTRENHEKLSRIFQKLELCSKQECDQKFSEMFPRKKYPNLHGWRGRQILFRKLTDVFGGSGEWRLLLDSDMLFFSQPTEMDVLLQAKETIFCQKDCWESYGYPRPLMESLAGAKLPEAINIGILNFSGKIIDWDKVEHWVGELERRHGRAYNITQGSFAMILAGKNPKLLDQENYKVYPRKPAKAEKPPVCGHYVADSKPWYFDQGWKKALEMAEVGN